MKSKTKKYPVDIITLEGKKRVYCKKSRSVNRSKSTLHWEMPKGISKINPDGIAYNEDFSLDYHGPWKIKDLKTKRKSK